jgi:hypothetical protein
MSDVPAPRGRGRPKRSDAERMRDYRAKHTAKLAKRSVQLKEYNARELRAKINSARVLDRLAACVEGRLELTPSQVRAAGMLLDRTMPVLSSQELHHHDETQSMTEGELIERLQAALAALPADARAAITQTIDLASPSSTQRH